ncbi:hypothetical protein L211DRAFT_842918 [Terfezia boudieri ATCC MYA-4762]|uniref:Hydrophobin n=1 Tax=Terfezia boudieri ATCC MYA-4762 TaxID=1051890 RepID=A0A3N4L8G0_9PEZI|nr:hypothetical protein L211DRAFT_842918 [Terfezia boudieri ATCC MYA-4762]
MQFSTLFTVATYVVLTWASPVEIVARQNTIVCAQSQTQACCEQIQTQNVIVPNIGNVASGGPITIPVNLAFNCIGINICNNNQKAFCCNQIVQAGAAAANGFSCS